jgi:GNAT superfamily N-acetyltransferase|tara:strand:- start:4668 stop:5321 length:654 start_codon:yes stop_codon:yes gene_type:complete
MANERLDVITWSDFQKGIAPLWKVEDPNTIPIFNNPYHIIQYPQHMWHYNIILFPVCYKVDDIPVAYSCVYNLSDTVIRTRGIFVLEEHRGKGYGHKIQKAQWDLFPKTFYRAFGFWREDSAPRFMQYSDMKIVPNTGWIWSDFSKVNMRFLYWDRRDTKPTDIEIEYNNHFIATQREKYSFGGTNNLNVDWDMLDWDEYFEKHRGNYEDLQINLDF